jgi:hypothetical protein
LGRFAWDRWHWPSAIGGLPGSYRRRRRRKLLGARLGVGLLQCAYGFVEAQPERLQQSGGRTFPVADDRREHNGSINLAAAGLLSRLTGRLQHAQQFGVGTRLDARLRVHLMQKASEVVGDVRSKPDGVHIRGAQDARGVRVLDEGQQKMLQQHGAMRLGTRKAARPFEALAQVQRHRNRFELLRKGLRHQRLPVGRMRPSRRRFHRSTLPSSNLLGL